MIILHKEIYIGRNLKEYMVVLKHNESASTWTVYLNDKNSIKRAVAVVANKPNVAILNNVVYVAGDGNTIKFAYYDSDDVYHSGTLSNAPSGEYLIASKNRLFLGGKTTAYYTTGKATFTQSDATITGKTYTTGTATFTKDSATVEGTSTAWNTGTPTNIVAGDRIGAGENPTIWYKVKSVESDTKLTLDKAFEETTNSTTKYINSQTNWESEARAGDMIGAGATPTVWYQIKKITNNYTLEVTVNYAATTATDSSYKVKRIANNIVYHSAEATFDDWQEPGIYGGDDAGFVSMMKPNTGIHNFDDAVVLFTEDEGFFIEGLDITQWSVPKRTRFPVGCISHESIASKNGYLTFTSQKGIYVTKGGEYRLDSLEATAFSSIIERSFDYVDQDRASAISAFAYKDSLFVSIPSTDEYSTTDTDLIYTEGTVEVAASSSYSTGTISVTNEKISVTGSSTAWLTNVSVGDLIGFGASPTKFYLVAGVSTNTSITLATPFAETTLSGSAYLVKVQKTVTGTGTEWLTSVYPGDKIKFGTSSTYYEIATVTADTTLTLSDNLATDYAATTTYIIQKRRNNKILVLDTRTNVDKKKYGWTIYDGVNATSFCFFNSKLFYGSSIDNYVYEYDTGGLMYDAPFTASALQKRTNCGFDGEKFFKAFLLKVRGKGRVYVTPYIDGVARDECDYTFDTGNNTEEIYFPRASNTTNSNKFSYIGKESQFKIELRGSNETAYAYPVAVGWIPLSRR